MSNSLQKAIYEVYFSEERDKYHSISDAILSKTNVLSVEISRYYLSKSKYEIVVPHSVGDFKGHKIERIPIDCLGHSEFGFIELIYLEASGISEDTLLFIASMLSRQLQMDWLRNLMDKAAQDVDPSLEEDDYIQTLAKVCRKAAASAYSLVYEAVEKNLYCRAVCDHEESFDERFAANAFTLPASSYVGKILSPAKAQDQVFLHSGITDLTVYFRDRLKDGTIETVLVSPITISKRRIGVLVFAYKHNFSFSGEVRRGIGILSNLVGAAIENFRFRKEREYYSSQIFWSGSQALNYELMQGFRHWAGHSVDDLDNYLFELFMRPELSEVQKQLEPLKKKINSARDDVATALENMERLSENYNFRPELTSIVDTFEQAKDILIYEIQRDSINFVYGQVDQREFLAHKDALRAVFLNLILNSIQAFRSVGRHPNPTIYLSTRKLDNSLFFTYSDNGPGIRLSKNIKSFSDVWKPEVSSKDGTGFGMPMIRHVIQNLHYGEINLKFSKSTQSGFTVEAILPTDGYEKYTSEAKRDAHGRHSSR